MVLHEERSTATKAPCTERRADTKQLSLVQTIVTFIEAFSFALQSPGSTRANEFWTSRRRSVAGRQEQAGLGLFSLVVLAKTSY